MSNRHRYQALQLAIQAEGGVECENSPELFFPDEFPDLEHKRRAAQMALNICAACPVKLLCFDYAVSVPETYGVWGGTLPGER